MTKYLLPTLLILLASPKHCGGQVQVGGVNTATPASIQVVLTPASIGIGGSSVLTASQVMTDGSFGVVRTAQCQWSSATPSVATISPVIGYGPTPTVVAVAGGTSVITCTDGTITGTATVTVTAPPVITSPTCGVPPCVLPQGINSTAYSGFTFTQSGCGGVNTWTVTVGTINTGLALSTAGVISGTPTVTATSTFTVQDSCSSPAGTASVQVSIQVIASVACGTIGAGGPPTYPCTPSNVLGFFAPTQIPFSGKGSAQTCPGVNCGADNTVVLNPEPIGTGNTSGLYHNPMVRVTNSFSGCGNGFTEPACPSTKQNAAFNTSNSDNDEDHWNTDDTKFYITDSGNTKYIYAFNPATLASTLLCSGYNGSMKLYQAPSFSRSNNWQMFGSNNATDTGSGTILSSWDTRNACPMLPTHIYDLSVTGSAFPASATNTCQPMNVSNPVGNTFDGFLHYGECFSTSGAQDSAQYAVDYHVDGGGNNIVITWNTQLGTTTSCTNTSCATNPIACQNCGSGVTDPGHFNIHNIKRGYAGDFYMITVGGGTCTTTCLNSGSPYLWQPSTGFVYLACNGSIVPPVGQTGTCGGHAHMEMAHWVNQYNTVQFASKAYTSNTNTKLSPAGRVCNNTQDNHSGNENNAGSDDTYFLVSTAGLGHVPNYTTECMESEVFLLSTPQAVTVGAPSTFKRMAHAYYGPNLNSCFAVQNSLAQISQTGKFALVTSSMNNGLGCMDGATSCSTSASTPSCNIGNNTGRGDAFIINLQ